MEEQGPAGAPEGGGAKPGGGQPFQLEGENIDQAHAEEEAGNGDADEGENRQAVVPLGILVGGGVDAQGHADDIAEQEGGDGEQQRGRQPLQDHLQHILAVIGAVAEIPLEQLLEPVPILHDDGLVQPQLFLGSEQRLRGGAGAEHPAQRAAGGHFHNEEG